jgi:long-chain acyl-CoA synthetase
MSLRTLNDILLAVRQSGRARVMLQKKATNWEPISAAEIYRGVVGVARALESWGIRKGDRVAILSENRPEWTITDFAALSLGAVTVPIYSTQTAEQTAFVLRDSGTRIIAVSTKSQLDKVLAIQGSTPVERIIVMDSVTGSDSDSMDAERVTLMQQLRLAGPTERDAAFDARSQSVEYRLFHGGLRLRQKGRSQLIVSAALPRDGPPCGFRIAISRRRVGLLS